MSAASDSAGPVTSTKRRRRRNEPPLTPANAQAVGQTSSGEANRRAAAILEVLAGERTPSEAADTLGVSLPHFYLLERKALEGLVRACEVQPKGPPPPSVAEKLVLVEQQLAAAQRECQRLTALVRVTQRAVGLPARPDKTAAKADVKTAGGAGKRSRRRKPSVRALRAAQTVRKNAQQKAASDLPPPAEVVQRIEVGNGSSSPAPLPMEARPPGPPS
jgi:hypothetical protein